MYQTDLASAVQPGAGGAVPPHACHACGFSAGRPATSGKRSALWWGLGGTLLSGVGWVVRCSSTSTTRAWPSCVTT